MQSYGSSCADIVSRGGAVSRHERARFISDSLPASLSAKCLQEMFALHCFACLELLLFLLVFSLLTLFPTLS